MPNDPRAAHASADDTTERAVGLFMRLPQLVDGDADLIRRGRFLTTDFALVVGTTPLMVRVDAGRVTSVTRGPFLLRPWAFSITAAADTWLRLLKPVPDPGTHDLMALSKVGLARIEGNLHPFMANLQVIKDIVAAPRTVAGGRAP